MTLSFIALIVSLFTLVLELQTWIKLRKLRPKK